MADIRPFNCVRPAEKYADQVAALPYDVYNREEAAEQVKDKPYSFLNIDRPETQFAPSQDMYAPEVYEKAKDLYESFKRDGIFVKDADKKYYIYELTMDGRSQTGIVAVASIDDYVNGVIKKHENTVEKKELDRINHVGSLSAQTGPIFLAYRSNKEIADVVAKYKKNAPLYDFVSEDGIGHRVFVIDGAEDIKKVNETFSGINEIYIADGHHRAASAVKVGLKRREEAKAKGTLDNEAEYNYFLSVLFPEDELAILPYNRAVSDLNGHSVEQVLLEIKKKGFDVQEMGNTQVSPEVKGVIGLYIRDKGWYKLTAGEALASITDPVESLDVSLLQNYILEPLLGITNPRNDKRIDFIGGIRGIGELERRANSDMLIAFSMYPTKIQELFAVADAGRLMPPKSTWFEPKLRSGLFIHEF